jgi:hypothetical protein
VRRLALVAATVAVAGCAGSARRSATPSKLVVAQATHEYPSPKPAPQTATDGRASAVAAVRAFASAYINWTADTVSADMRMLAARSIGQARSLLELAAAQTASDYELQRGGIANAGKVEAVAPLPGSGRDRYVVVTRESTTATNTTAYQGLQPAWHVALATVARLPTGSWAVSDWQPES